MTRHLAYGEGDHLYRIQTHDLDWGLRSFSLSIDKISAILGLAIFRDEAQDELSVLADAVFVAVVSVDEYGEAGGLQGDLRALVVAGGSAHAADGVAIDGQSLDVDCASANAFVRLAGAPDAQRERVAHELRGVESADGVAKADAGQIDEIYEGVDLIEGFALQHAADEGLGSGSIARGVFAASLVDAARGGYARHLLQRLSGQLGFVLLAQGLNLLPQSLGVRRVHDVGLHASAHESGAHLLNLIGYNHFHTWVQRYTIRTEFCN